MSKRYRERGRSVTAGNLIKIFPSKVSVCPDHVILAVYHSNSCDEKVLYLF